MNHVADFASRWKRPLNEKVVYILILIAAQENAVSTRDCAPGSPNLLVVRNGGTGGLVVNDESEVRFVVADSQSCRGCKSLNSIFQESLFQFLSPIPRFEPIRFDVHSL